MKFRFGTWFQLYTEYELEEDSLKEALTSLHKYVCEDLDLNTIKLKKVSYDWVGAPFHWLTISASKEDMVKSLQRLGEMAEVAETGDWSKVSRSTIAELTKPKPEEENVGAAKPKRVRKNKKDKEDPK